MITADTLRELPGLRASDLPGLTPEQHHQLIELISASNARQERDYADAVDQSLSMVPALLRGTLRKMVLG